MSDEQPRQLRLTPKDPPKATQSGGRGKKEEKANKWVLVLILVLTVIVTLVFYFGGGRKQTSEPNAMPQSEKGGLFGPKIYKF